MNKRMTFSHFVKLAQKTILTFGHFCGCNLPRPIVNCVRNEK